MNIMFAYKKPRNKIEIVRNVASSRKGCLRMKFKDQFIEPKFRLENT